MAQVQGALPSSPGTFARASSGLVRSVGTIDAMWYGLNAITIAYIGFTLIDWVAYPGASFEWSVLITTLGSIGVGIVYALLAATYPRSGGEYVFLSRIVRPELGFVVSFMQAFFYTFYFGLNGAFFAIFGRSGQIAAGQLDTKPHDRCQTYRPRPEIQLGQAAGDGRRDDHLGAI